jgi:hypothetical protein
MTRIGGLGVALALGLVVGQAQGGEPRDEARALAQSGSAAFKEQRYAEALERFEAAEARLHAPTHLLMLARTHLALGDVARAREAYRSLVAEPLPDGAPPAFAKAREEGAAELALLDARYLVAPVAPVAAPPPPAPAAPSVAPAAPPVAAAAAVAPVAPAAAPATLAPRAEAPAAPVPAPDEGSGSPLRVVSITGMVAGVGGLAFGLAAMPLALSKAHAADVARAAGDAARGAALDRSASALSTASTAGLVAGAALVTTGLGLFILSADRTAEGTPTAHVAGFVGPGTAGLRGAF